MIDDVLSVNVAIRLVGLSAFSLCGQALSSPNLPSCISPVTFSGKTFSCYINKVKSCKG